MPASVETRHSGPARPVAVAGYRQTCRAALRFLGCLLLLGAGGLVLARDLNIQTLPPEESRELPTPVRPSINVQERDNHIAEEYSVGDQVYMVKITPKHGAPYYIADPKGTGQYAWQRDAAGMDVRPPEWAVLKW